MSLSRTPIQRDLGAGAVAALVTLCFSASFAAMIFSGPLARDLDLGLAMALTSAAVTVALVAWRSPFAFAIAGPDSRSAAVQTAIAATLAARLGAEADDATRRATLCIGIAGTTVLTGLALYACGRARIGQWIRYVPYPVVGGFLASAGFVLGVGGLRVATGLQLSNGAFSELTHGAAAAQALCAIGFAIVLGLAMGKARHFLTLPIALVVGTALVHGVLRLAGTDLAEARASAWLIDVGSAVRAPAALTVVDLGAIDTAALGALLGEAVALCVVTALGVLVTAAALEIALRTDADLDRELRAHGIANLVSGAVGGLVGANSAARTLLAREAGATSRVCGAITAVACALVLWIEPAVIGVFARPIMGGTLLYLGGGLLVEWVVRGRRKLAALDHAIVFAMVVAVAVFGFVPALVLGVLASCALFAFRYAAISAVRQRFTNAEHTSTEQRNAHDLRLLAEHGHESWVVRLRGHLFFGSAVGLSRELRTALDAANGRPPRRVVLDFHAVTGIDSSAALAISRLRQVTSARRIEVWTSGASPDVRAVLAREGAIGRDGIEVHATLDEALRACEALTLSSLRATHGGGATFEEHLAAELGTTELARRFLARSEAIPLEPGGVLYRVGDAADSFCVLESGCVDVVAGAPDASGRRL
ncbi:MAG: STAS domain-containing protein, partial [Planctomycetes bacterium]|nr:STAS domain-containing protein [Planctomycetota bacterium]